MRLFVAGEGPDDIGDFAIDRAYRPVTCRGGVIETLLKQVRADGWTIVDGCPWRRIRKYAYGRDLHGRERRNVLGLVDQALEAGCGVVAFIRDRDGEKERERSIERTISEVRHRDSHILLIGGVAIESLDAWILACLGENTSEDLTDPKSALNGRGVSTRMAKVEVVEKTKLSNLPADARSLHTWIDRAEGIFALP